MADVPSAYDRFERLVANGMDPESAHGITTGARAVRSKIGPFYAFEDDERYALAERLYPDCSVSYQDFLIGWRRAEEGHERIELATLVGTENKISPARALGFDTYMNRYGPTWWREKNGTL